MSYTIGLVGKPSVGKSTLNAATMNDVPEGAYPFTTIDPSVGEAYVGVDCAAPEFDEFGGTGVQRTLETALFDELDAKAVFPGSANGGWERGPFRDCFVLPGDATAETFAPHLHSDIGDGFLHGIDCRSGRQVGADTELDHRDVVEIVTTG